MREQSGQKSPDCSQLVKKASQNLPLKAANPFESIFRRGVYLAENTPQDASVEFVRPWRTNYARSRLQETCQKSPWGFLTV